MKFVPFASRNKRISNSRQRKQQHLLDVKIRESKERSRRFRAVAGFIFKTTLLVSCIAGAWIGGKEALRRFLWENPDYFLRDVGFTTDGTLTREQVLTASGIIEGRNIFTVDIAKARTEIEKLPQVESVEVQRTLPNHVAIVIAERRPIAWVAAKGDEDPTASERSMLIDARGIVLRSRVVLPEYYHLPIISGVETGNLAPGQRVTTSEMQAALELVRLNVESTRFQVRNLDLAKGYCIVVTDQRRAKITFGLDRVEAQVERLNRLLDAVEPTHRELRTVNLLVERNLPVTFYDPEAEAAAAAAATAPKYDAKGKLIAPVAAKGKIDPVKEKFLKTTSTPAPAKATPASRVKKPFKTSNG